MLKNQSVGQHCWWLFWLICLVLLLSGPNAPTTHAETFALPDVHYESATNTITVGSASGLPAGSQPITIPELAAALSNLGQPGLLVDEGGGLFLLKANLLIETTARLEATAATLAWLRLDSPPLNIVSVTTRRGGHLLIDGIKVTSWDSTLNAVDENTANQRSYLLALEGGRMDILHSEVAYLGWQNGEPSGLSWRGRLNPGQPTTGATGRVEDSSIHHNYFGLYTFEAYGLKILRNQVYNNISYGIDPHDDSRALEVAYNHVYGNGNHGIIFSRLCIDNLIHHNEVHDNALHGIMLDRESNHNVISENLVYNNQDGIAIFQSSDNEVRNNTLRNNLRGIRINATFDSDDRQDGLAAYNQVRDNLIEDSSEQGIYLYARADRNLIAGNTIVRSGVNGIYIKSGGNRIENNSIREGVVGIHILGGEYLNDPPAALPALDPPGQQNVVVSTTITLNSDVGIRILGGSHNRIGPASEGETGNRIEANGKDGVAIGDAINGAVATDNQIISNRIHNNLRHGVLVTDASSVRNRISRNSITANGRLGIKIESGAQANITSPTINRVQADGEIGGAAPPNSVVEVYSDPGASAQRLLDTVTTSLYDDPVQGAAANRPSIPIYATTDREGAIFLGEAVAGPDGSWTFQVPAAHNPTQATALAIDADGNTSAFSSSGSGEGSAFFALVNDDNGQTTIQVTGNDAAISLGDVQAGLGGANNNHLLHLGNGVWRLNANLFIGPDVTLNLSPSDGVTELQLRSERSAAVTASATNAIDYASFVYVRVYNGVINLDQVKVYSWDAAANTVDFEYENGRAYLLAKYDAAMNIRNSEVSYLGSADGESYGISWRDINDSAAPDVLRTRVTGEVIESNIHHNYYGIYTFQASGMLFRGTQFHHNVRYGFDPHDYTHNVLVENNLAYNNGAHGFIISRGCNNFVFRNNKSYDNLDPTSNQAHGFMLDPGSPNSTLPQAPSFENLFENNEAYGNEGFGFRILGSHSNEVRNNRFLQNEVGISLDLNSTGNTISGNLLAGNRTFGVQVREGADGNTITENSISDSGSHGLYVRANNTLIQQNRLEQNQQAGIALLPASGFPSIQKNQLISNTITGNLESGIDLRRAQQTRVQENLVEGSGVHGIYLTNEANQNAMVRNIVRTNGGYGIRAHGALASRNSWSQNQIYANQTGGIATTDGANLGLSAPELLNVVEQTVYGRTKPDAVVEVFADEGSQGRYYEGQTVVTSNGIFSLTIAGPWQAGNLTAVTLDGEGNSSSFSAPRPVSGMPAVTPTPTATVEVDPETPTPTGTPEPGDALDTLYLPLIQN